MSPFRHHRPRCLAITLALLALVVRLLLPALHHHHDHHHGGERHVHAGYDLAAHDGTAATSSCGCAPTPTTTVWWHAANDGVVGDDGADGDGVDGDGGDGDGGDGADGDGAPTPSACPASASGECLACAAELLPLAAAAPPTFAAAPPAFVRAGAPALLAAPRCAAVRARHPCRAPPTTAA